jgi:hypothetical protein
MMPGDTSAHLQNAVLPGTLARMCCSCSDIAKGNPVNKFRDLGRYVPRETLLQETRSNFFTSPYTKKQTPWLESAGANYTDRATAACRRS